MLPTMAMASNSRSPSLTALNRAVRSAPLVGVFPPFYTFQPVYTRPLLPNRAAPTLK